MEQTIKTDWKKLSREERGKLIFENAIYISYGF